MSAFQWFQVVSTLAFTALIPFGVSLWRSRRKVWERERQLDDALRIMDEKMNGLSQRLQRDLSEKVDCKIFDGLKERALLRLDFIDKRIDETSAANAKRIDKESERFSDLTGKITVWHETCRGELSEIRERIVRLESRAGKT